MAELPMWDSRPGSCQAHSGKFARCCPYTVGAINCQRRHNGVHSTWQITCLIWIDTANIAVYWKIILLRFCHHSFCLVM